MEKTETASKDWKWLELKTGEKVKVDAEDFDRLNQIKWVLRLSSYRKPQVINMTWDSENQIIVTKYLAREIMQVQGNLVVNRIDPTKLDFRKTNLIVCSRKEKERMRNKAANIKTTSKYKGVCWNKITKKWVASICVDARRIRLGQFDTEKLAAEAYNEAAKIYFENFAFLNKIK